MLIICQIDWSEVEVAVELQCLRNCTLSSILLMCLSFFWYRDPNLLALRAALPRQKYLRSLVSAELENSLRHFAHPPPKFYTGENCEIWPRFSIPAAFESLSFRKWARYLKSNTNLGEHRWAIRVLPILDTVQFSTLTREKTATQIRRRKTGRANLLNNP